MAGGLNQKEARQRLSRRDRITVNRAYNVVAEFERRYVTSLDDATAKEIAEASKYGATISYVQRLYIAWKAWRSQEASSRSPAASQIALALLETHLREVGDCAARLRGGLPDDPVADLIEDPEWGPEGPDDPADLYDEFTDWDAVETRERARDERPDVCDDEQVTYVQDHLRGAQAGEALDRALGAWPAARRLWRELEELRQAQGEEYLRGQWGQMAKLAKLWAADPRLSQLLHLVDQYTLDVAAFRKALTPDARLRKLISQGHCDLCP